MEYLELPAPPPLDRVIHRFWFLRVGADEIGGTQTIVPDGRSEIVLHLGEPFAQVDRTGRPVPQGRALVAGQLTGPLQLVPRPGAEVVGIRLRTGAAGRLLGVPQHELTGRVAPLGEVMRRLEPSLLDAAALPGDWRVRAGRLARALAGALPDLSPHPLDAAVARLELGTADDITMLARSVALTPRTLQRRFQDQVGLDPTLLRRIFRFRTAFRLLERLPPGRWSQVAPRAGYFDQAHLIREFRRFAGSAPSAFFGAEPELARVFGGSEPAE